MDIVFSRAKAHGRVHFEQFCNALVDLAHRLYPNEASLIQAVHLLVSQN